MISVFMISFYAYTMMGIDYVIKPYYAYKTLWLYASILMLIMTFFITQRGHITLNVTLPDILIAGTVLLMLIWNNYDFQNNEYFRFIGYLMVIIAYYIFKQRDAWIHIMVKAWRFVGVFYAIGTIWVFIMPSAYENIIYPLYKEIMVHDLLQFYRDGCISGITAHYTTNGIYLQLGFGVLACACFLHEKKEKIKISTYIMFAMVTFALLITGKRAHLFFAIAAFVATYYVFNVQKKWKRITKIIFAGIAAFIALFVIAQFVPEVLTPFMRLISGIEEGNLSNGRDAMQVIALAGFISSPIAGNGWDWFPYHNTLFGGGDFAHNVYKQLLCDTGIIGTALFVSLFAVCLFRAFTLLKNAKLERVELTKEQIMFLCIAVYNQVFFLLYCTSGNPLYDTNCYLTYFCSIAIVEILRGKTRTIKKGKHEI